ncbi:MAG: phosphatidylserine decarboxylase family protein [Deltaproteobacteria bacterium]|nr:phosphatidylserine decarboxylase family protein [Deltaproteobacteria bacterium]
MRTKEHHAFALEGIFIVVIEFIVFFVFLSFHLYIIAGILFITILFTFYFFRNPKRIIPSDSNLIVAPADGVVVDISEVKERLFLKREVLKLSIFMSLFNAHINRFPIEGEVLDIHYNSGKFYPASREKSSLLNEQNGVFIKTKNDKRLVVVQIAGIIARRIVCYAKRTNIFKKGEIFGLIRFGSRVDVYMPFPVKINVKLGDRVRAGETIIGVIDE